MGSLGLFTLISTILVSPSIAVALIERYANATSGLVDSSSHSPPITTPPPRSLDTLDASIPGLWTAVCGDGGKPPCEAYCQSNDTACLEAASSIVSTCEPAWNSWNSLRDRLYPNRFTYDLITSRATAFTATLTATYYPSYQTADVTITKPLAQSTGLTTFMPVYALGKPFYSPTVLVYTSPAFTYSFYRALPPASDPSLPPSPTCKYDAVLTTDLQTSTSTESPCGQCSINGGTVGLYYWPPIGAATDLGGSETSAQPLSTVLDGSTLVYPTVYISLATIYATNTCSQVGQKHHGTLLAMNPTDVSTQYNIGMMAFALHTGRLRYEDLTGLPPATVYQAQPSCQLFGCPTMLPTFDPTLIAPHSLTDMDPAWKDCLLPIEGLYDPPVALTPAAAIAEPTVPSAIRSPTAASVPLTKSYAHRPIETAQSRTVDAGSPSLLQNSLSDILAGSMTSTPVDKPPQAWSQYSTEHSPNQVDTTISSPQLQPGNSDYRHGHTVAQDENQSPTKGAQSETSFEFKTIATKAETSLDPPWTQNTSTLKISTGLQVDTTIPAPLDIVVNSEGNFLVNGQTFAPHAAITLQEAGTVATAKMITSAGRTFIALGTTETVPFGAVVTETSMATASTYTDLAVSMDKDGDLVVEGTTFHAGTPIIFRSGTRSSVIEAINASGQPELLIDGTTMQLPPTTLEHTALYTAASMTFTTDHQGHHVIAGSTLLPGSIVTITEGSGSEILPLTFPSGSAAVVVDGTESALVNPLGTSTRSLRSLSSVTSASRSSGTPSNSPQATRTQPESSSVLLRIPVLLLLSTCTLLVLIA